MNQPILIRIYIPSQDTWQILNVILLKWSFT